MHNTNDVPKVPKHLLLCSLLIVDKVSLALTHVARKFSFQVVLLGTGSMRSCTGQIHGHVKLESLILPLVVVVCCLKLTVLVQALVLELLSLIQSMRKK